VTEKDALNGKPYAGNPHVRFDEGEVASTTTPRRGCSLRNDKAWDSGLMSASNSFCSWRLLVSLLYAGMAAALNAASISSLSTESYLDNHESPKIMYADAGGNTNITFEGAWFESGSCELLVNGKSVGVSSETAGIYRLPIAADAVSSFSLTLKTESGEMTKHIAVFPSAGFKCSCHGLNADKKFLDSHPAGTVRRVKFSSSIPVAWSAKWSDGADRAVVDLYKGRGVSGTALNLVSVESVADGEFELVPSRDSLPCGKYTLTHYDGNETLVAYVDVRHEGFTLVFR